MRDDFKLGYVNNNYIYDIVGISNIDNKLEITILDEYCKTTTIPGEYVNEENIIKCTGLQDDCGNLIWEHSIIQWHYENYPDPGDIECGEVVWNKNYHYPAFDIENGDFDCNGLSYLFENGYHIKVIGNSRFKDIQKQQVPEFKSPSCLSGYLDIAKRHINENEEDVLDDLQWNVENELELFFEKCGEESRHHGINFLVYEKLYEKVKKEIEQ